MDCHFREGQLLQRPLQPHVQIAQLVPQIDQFLRGRRAELDQCIVELFHFAVALGLRLTHVNHKLNFVVEHASALLTVFLLDREGLADSLLHVPDAAHVFANGGHDFTR